jgi:hypothetical protein
VVRDVHIPNSNCKRTKGWLRHAAPSALPKSQTAACPIGHVIEQLPQGVGPLTWQVLPQPFVPLDCEEASERELDIVTESDCVMRSPPATETESSAISSKTAVTLAIILFGISIYQPMVRPF